MPSADGPREPGDGGPEPAPQTGAPVFVNPDYLPAPEGTPTFVNRRGEAFGGPGDPAAANAVGGEYAGHRVVGQGPDGGPVFLAPEPGGSDLDADRPWGWWLGPLAILVAFIVVIMLGAVLAIASGGDSQSMFDDNEHWLGLAQDALWVAVAITVPYLFARHLRPAQLGLRRPPQLGRTIGVLVLVLVVFYLLAAAYSAITGLSEDSNTLLKDTGFGDSLTRDVAFAILFTVAAPVAEELLFRGLLFRTLRDGFSRLGHRTGIALGAVVSGVIFGGIHVGGGQDDFLPVLMVLGVLLALAYQWSGSIYVSMAIHSINNAIATGANSTPSADWVYGLIAAGPVLAILTAMGIARFVRTVFPQDPPAPPADSGWAHGQAPPAGVSNP